jgi:hypothetical protein
MSHFLRFSVYVEDECKSLTVLDSSFLFSVWSYFWSIIKLCIHYIEYNLIIALLYLSETLLYFLFQLDPNNLTYILSNYCI